MANASDASYQWIDCNDGNKPIIGQTHQGFNVPGNGNYAVMISKNGCTDTSFCFAMNIVGIVEYLAPSLTVYPNPSNGKFNLSLGNVLIEDHFNVAIYNNYGIKIYQSVISNHEDHIDLSNESKGVYYLKVTKGYESMLTDKIIIH